MVRMLGKFWTFSNVLSIIRAILAFPIAVLIVQDGPITWILGLIIIAVSTDWFDGTIARLSHTVSEWGKVLDPVADKIGAISVVVALVLRGALPVWFLALVLVRDLLIIAGSAVAARRLGRVMMSIWLGKVAVFFLSLTVLGALLKADPPIMNFLIALTSILVVYSFILYLLRFIRVMRAPAIDLDSPMGDGENREINLEMATRDGDGKETVTS